MSAAQAARVPDVIEGEISIADGLPGFETYQRFVLVGSESFEPFTMIQGLGDAAPAFVAVDPYFVDPHFAFPLTAGQLARLDATVETPLLWLAIVSGTPDGEATVNLRAPVVINPASMRGLQVVGDRNPYRYDHPLPER